MQCKRFSAEIDCEVTCCADDVTVNSIPTYHDGEKGAKRGNNLVFCFEIDGLKVVHMGDVGFSTRMLSAKLRIATF